MIQVGFNFLVGKETLLIDQKIVRNQKYYYMMSFVILEHGKIVRWAIFYHQQHLMEKMLITILPASRRQKSSNGNCVAQQYISVIQMPKLQTHNVFCLVLYLDQIFTGNHYFQLQFASLYKILFKSTCALSQCQI